MTPSRQCFSLKTTPAHARPRARGRGGRLGEATAAEEARLKSAPPRPTLAPVVRGRGGRIGEPAAAEEARPKARPPASGRPRGSGARSPARRARRGGGGAPENAPPRPTLTPRSWRARGAAPRAPRGGGASPKSAPPPPPGPSPPPWLEGEPAGTVVPSLLAPAGPSCPREVPPAPPNREAGRGRPLKLPRLARGGHPSVVEGAPPPSPPHPSSLQIHGKETRGAGWPPPKIGGASLTRPRGRGARVGQARR